MTKNPNNMSRIPHTLIGSDPTQQIKEKKQMIYIFWSCRNPSEAKQIIHDLLNQRLIACASIYPQVESIYRGEGKIEEATESKVILKTSPEHFDAIESYVRAHCSYDVREIVQVDISRENPAYL